MDTLKRGQIGVNKNRLIEHCISLHSSLNYLDKVMLEKESNERGKKIAKAWNAINFSLHTLEHFDLNIPLDKLGTECPLPKKSVNYVDGVLPSCFSAFIKSKQLSKEWDKWFKDWQNTLK